MKCFEERVWELIRTNPNGVRSMTSSENEYERVIAEIILETEREIE